jgi:hypothetical protein
MIGPLVREKDSKANAPRTEGLTPLDRERAASIADEGGASAAEVEEQRRPTPPPLPNPPPLPKKMGPDRPR